MVDIKSTHGWEFDPVWNYFVRGDQIALHEHVVAPALRDWASGIGLTPDIIKHLLAHPTRGAYQQEQGRTTA